MSDLEEKLSQSDARVKLIVTDGVFSMDGDIAPLDKICDLADKYVKLINDNNHHVDTMLL